jgi:quinoprotein relay system zinc metallohydrolase 2
VQVRSSRSVSGATRRRILSGAAGLACASILPAATGPNALIKIAPGIFIRRGIDAEATRANRDAIGNAGFVIGSQSVAVTDPGGSHADGAWLRTEIRRRTRLPISHVIVSHGHPDHDFGASAFVDDRAIFVGHQRLAAVYAARGDYDRIRLAQILGDALAGRLVSPTRLVAEQASLPIDLGERTITVTAHPTAHSPADLTLSDSTTGILFAGDLLFVDRVPALDGSVRGWIAVLETMVAEGVRRAVPGHGPALVSFPTAVVPLLRYLRALRDDTRAAIVRGLSIPAAIDVVGRSERGRWRLFDAYHGRNVTMAYKELEWE